VYALSCRPPSRPTGLVFGWFVAAAKEKASLPVEKPYCRVL
jgi:hypothetical protein